MDSDIELEIMPGWTHWTDAHNLLASPNIDCICVFRSYVYRCLLYVSKTSKSSPVAMVHGLIPRGNPIGQQIYWLCDLKSIASGREPNLVQFNPSYQDLPLACRSVFIPTGQKRSNTSFSPSVQAQIYPRPWNRPRNHNGTISGRSHTRLLITHSPCVFALLALSCEKKNTSTCHKSSWLPSAKPPKPDLECHWSVASCGFSLILLTECWWALCLDSRF
jgi:hypothetical protein